MGKVFASTLAVQHQLMSLLSSFRLHQDTSHISVPSSSTVQPAFYLCSLWQVFFFFLSFLFFSFLFFSFFSFFSFIQTSCNITLPSSPHPHTGDILLPASSTLSLPP